MGRQTSEARFSEIKEIKLDQEAIALFLNTPVRENWMKILKLSKIEQGKINKIIERYAKLKINTENKSKPKTKKQIVHIEDLCLKRIFLGEVIKIRKAKNRSNVLKIAKKLIASRYKNAVILDSHKLNDLAVLTGADGTKGKFATDFLVFDADKKMIIGIVVLTGQSA